MIHRYLSALRDAVFNNFALDIDNALNNTVIRSFYETWSNEFSGTEFDWSEIQGVLKKAISPIDVIEVNSSKGAEKEIDYSERSWDEGRHLIVVGGLSLSRGITLEGLTTTYFLRNSIMYDTLMQMGRWFGYRPGYEDLCRVYMTAQARSWYEHISLATDELRDEFKRMDDLNKTPKDFGLCVRNHPDSLIVTARNKMRSARPVLCEIDLSGRLIETTRLFTDTTVVNQNMRNGIALLEKVRTGGVAGGLDGTGKFFWSNVSHEVVCDFVNSFQNHPESAVTESGAVKQYIEKLATEERITEWNVLFVNITRASDKLKVEVPVELAGIGPGLRSMTTSCTAGIMLGQRKLGAGGLEKIDLGAGEVRETPLLMVHLLDCRLKSKKDDPVFQNGVMAYGIAFPGEKNGRRISKLAEYQVNKVWWQEKYGYDFEDDDDMKGEYE